MNTQYLFRPETGSQVAFVSTYPPTECGLATFTQDLVHAVEAHDWQAKIISADHSERALHSDSRVICQIRREEPQDYLEAANLLNRSKVNVVCVQHEYGIFGGELGAYLLDFMDALQLPVITTLHTVVPNPSPEMKAVLQQVVSKSQGVVVMARTAVELLRKVYETPVHHVCVIPHGTPAPLNQPIEVAKRQLGLENLNVLSTFGLVSRGKGIEDAIRAMPAIVERFPNTVYLALGETHPKVKSQEGESYREFLVDEACRLGVEKNVLFVDHYLSLKEIQQYLNATDIYITPYLNPDQITSGTLAYAISAGCAVVSTPYLYAKELLEEGGGKLAEFRNPESIAQAVLSLLSDPSHLKLHRGLAKRKGAVMSWDLVGSGYANLFASFGRHAPTPEPPHYHLVGVAAS